MGQCMSRKAAGAFAASTASTQKPTKMQRHSRTPMSMDTFSNLLMDECPPDLQSPGDEEQDPPKRASSYSKGVASSFGFKRRPVTAPSIASNSNAARRLANSDTIDRNGNGNIDTEPLTSNAARTGRSTPRLMPPKKEGSATRVNRFGFRQPQINRLHKVSDLNNSPAEFCNNNGSRIKTNTGQVKFKGNMGATTDNNKNRTNKITSPPAEKFMLQTTQLPRLEPIRVIETKTAKTLVNNSRRIASTYHEDNSSKDGSLTEDSGVGSHISGEVDTVLGVEKLNRSPTYGARRNNNQSRNLEIIRAGNTFDVRDLEDSSENCAPLPQLPSAFKASAENFKGVYHNSGFVRERTLEYQRHIDNGNRRKISVTSSDGFSDDYGDEEKTCLDKFKSEKTFIKNNFLKSRPSVLIRDDSSPPSSDEQEWTHGGEAMADEVSFSISSSDESKEKEHLTNATTVTSALQTLMNASLTNTFPTAEIKNALLTIEDPKFAAVAAASNTSLLLDDETSPVDSLISSSETEEIFNKKIAKSSSNSKDINEKLTPPTPGTPTNASNSLSLSDGKDDFLIDDEIADQPALIFEDAITIVNTISQGNSESTPTIVDSTPKPKRKSFLGFEGSPLSLRKKKAFHSRAGSLDTLSPCESIASDDLMMDFDYSQSSGLEDMDRTEVANHHGFSSLDDSLLRKGDVEQTCGVLRDWGVLLGTTERLNRSNASRTSRLLWSRTGTPNSIPDSPKSLDSKSTAKSRYSVTNSPLRLSKGGPLSSAGYDSDDSIKLDRANHSAMKQDLMSIKTMLIKLKRVLNEQPDEDTLLRSETHIPFDGQLTLTNGLFNGLCSGGDDAQSEDGSDTRLELSELRRQVLFLQGQLEDKENTVKTLQDQVFTLANENYSSQSAPASTVTESNSCNAATQTERIRPISAGPSLLNGSTTDESIGSLVSANESQQRRSRPPPPNDVAKTTTTTRKISATLWRKPGEPPTPQRFINHSSIPRRANSRTRTPSIPS